MSWMGNETGYRYAQVHQCNSVQAHPRDNFSTLYLKLTHAGLFSVSGKQRICSNALPK